jgi:hypothetical protein
MVGTGGVFKTLQYNQIYSLYYPVSNPIITLRNTVISRVLHYFIVCNESSQTPKNVEVNLLVPML